MALRGTDISAFQAVHPPMQGNQFAIPKATEGVGWQSPVWAAQVQALRPTGILLGHYHFANGLNSPQAEAQYFWGVVSSLWQVGDVLAVDVEASFFTNASDPVGWTAAFIVELRRLSGVTALTYLDSSHVNAYDWSRVVNTGSGLWGAAYNNSGFGPTGAWPIIAIWQNADTNISGGDSDVFYGDAAAWRRYGTPSTSTKPDSTTVTPIPKDWFEMATKDDLRAVIDEYLAPIQTSSGPVPVRQFIANGTRAAEAAAANTADINTSAGPVSLRQFIATGTRAAQAAAAQTADGIAATIPDNLAKQVIDLLSARLSAGSGK